MALCITGSMHCWLPCSQVSFESVAEANPFGTVDVSMQVGDDKSGIFQVHHTKHTHFRLPSITSAPRRPALRCVHTKHSQKIFQVMFARERKVLF